MRRGGSLFIGGLVVLAGVGIAIWNWNTSAEAPTSASFGFQDWVVRCQSAKATVGCGMSQQILDQRSQQSVLQLHLARDVKGEGHQLVVVMPLGVTVPPGVVVQIGDLKRNVAFTQCLPGGCVAPVSADAKLVEQMQSGADGRVVVLNRVGRQVAVPFSLKGFSPAFKKMEAQGGIGKNDATWWTQFWNSSGTK